MTKYVEVRCGNVVLASKAKYLDNFWFKARGLMFSMPLKKGSGLVLVSKDEGILETTIHMLFVFYPIDILWVNSGMEVVDIKRNVLPFIPFISPRKPAKYVIELPRKACLGIKIGNKIRFE